MLEILKDEKIHVNDDLADIKDSLLVLNSKVNKSRVGLSLNPTQIGMCPQY